MIYDKLPVVFLSTIASEKQGSTNSQIAAYLLDHLEQVQNIGIKDMAAMCNVAVSSISRFCKEIGLNDYAELRELLTTTKLYFEKSSAGGSSHQLLDDYSIRVKQSIDMVSDSIDMELISNLCQDIRRYKRVAIFGLLKGAAVALGLQTDLRMLGKQTYTNISYSQQIQYILSANKDDLILLLSYTGSYFDYQNIRILQQKRSIPKIWFIASGNHQVPSFVSRVISFASLQDQTSHPYQLQFVAGLIAREYAEGDTHAASS